MAVGNFLFIMLMALVAVNIIFADTEQSPHSGDQQHAQGDGDQDPNGRFFFRNFFTTCNYTATPGATCLSCSTAARCLPSNVGIARVCRGFLPYCNGGRCSFIPGTNCTGSG